MMDYRNDVCIIDEKVIKKCIAQDFFTGKLYFQLDKGLEHLDCDYCIVPSFQVTEDRVRILSEKELQDYIIDQSMNDPISILIKTNKK